MIKDCFGFEAQVGDEIFFSRGNSGAKPWERGVITKITKKSVIFQGKTGGVFRWYGELRRGEGTFVIDMSKR